MSTTNSPNPQTQGKPNDLLGYDVYAKTLWARIVAALDKDKLQPAGTLGDDPLVVGIFGEWGAGKSKLLSLIQTEATLYCNERIENHKNYNGYAPLTVPVFFQPWKYEHEQHLLVPMLLHILVALEETLKKAKTFDDKLIGSVHKGVDAAVSSVGGLIGATKKFLGVADPTSAVALAMAQTLSTQLPKERKKVAQASQFIFKDDGRAYYDMHRVLAKITRPGKYPEVAGNTFQDKDFAVNFVIFIDDLDRCLPEKSVAMLELIKTIFNLESFAFVLALDEEVVERGIGHRYRDYALANKKPEMPITGFEYLEKIVHLPFRLPALTAAQAVAFMRKYEADTLEARAASLQLPAEAKTAELKARWRQDWIKSRSWFDIHAEDASEDGVRMKTVGGEAGSEMLMSSRGQSKSNSELRWNLAELVAASFSAHVPRKLVRVVELFHQVLNVLEAQGRLIHLRSAQGQGDTKALDPRLLMAHVLLQLFQPELHRAMRRSVTGFEVLLRSFEKRSDEEMKARPSARQLSESSSDVDILHWALYWSGLAPATLRSSHIRIAGLEDEERYPAQRIRLVLAERLLEHRTQQRHVFDPLRLFSALQLSRSIEELGQFEGRHWFGLLAKTQSDTLPPAENWLLQRRSLSTLADDTIAASDQRARVALQDVNAVYLALISPEKDEQARLAEIAGLQAGQLLEKAAAQQLLAMIEQRWLKDQVSRDISAPSGNNNHVEIAFHNAKSRLLQGLSHLAHHISREDGAAFWDLVKDTADYAPSSGEIGAEEFADKETIARRELWADVRSTLGQDPRFDAARLYLPKERRAGHTEAQEPIPGFVRIPAGTYQLGASGKGFEDNPPYDAKLAHDYFMARHLTTVDQYAAFIRDKGYDDDKLWDSLGWQWRTGAWDSQVKEKAYREHLARRKPELRHQPMDWDAQRPHGSRAVMQLCWFEARAYCRWLTGEMQNTYRSEIDSTLRKFYAGQSPESLQIRLPTEMQWERAARAANSSQNDARQYPWGGDDQSSAHLHANLNATDIDRASVVGLFAGNPLGMADLAGNLWEWQGNLYQSGGTAQQGERVAVDVKDFKTHDEWQKSDTPALRGGSWNYSAENARASFRGAFQPVYWYNYVGFRLVLSLA